MQETRVVHQGRDVALAILSASYWLITCSSQHTLAGETPLLNAEFVSSTIR